MTHVLSLIAHHGQALPPEMLDQARDRIAQAGGQTEAPDWLSPGRAVDVPFTGADPVAMQTTLAGPADAIAQPIQHRRKRLFIADMDSTMIAQECIDELADLVGAREKVSEITERAMRGELDFEGALRERVAMLKGLAETELDRVFRERITLTPGGPELVKTMATHGATTALVSSGFTFFTSRVAEACGFAAHFANELDFRDGVLSGEVIEPILGAQAKLDRLNRYLVALRISADQVLAVGDGANDIPMLQAAGLGVAFCAKPKTKRAASAFVDGRDLRALLYAQGYRDAEIVTD